jgi:hypothetical protein
MNPLDIPELLLLIFYFGSESDITIDYGDFGSPPSIPHGYSHPRSPKPFFRSLICVKKNWRQIVQSVPSFWVTRVSFRWINPEETEMGLVRTGLSLLSPREQYTAAEELLNGSNGSDIDISINFVWASNPEAPESSIILGELDLWMDAHIFSASDRVRQLSFFSDDVTLLEMVINRFLLRSWPRLRALNLEGTERVTEVSQAFNTPQLSFASFMNVNWIEDRFGLANSNLSSLRISQDPEYVTDDDFQSCTVMTYLSPSLLSSLTELRLMLWDEEQQEHVISNVPPSLSFARLERMSLTFITAEDIWHFLKCVDAPQLTVLYISTSLLTESGIPNEAFSQRFPLLEDMGFFFITPSWTSVFLGLLPPRDNRLSTLSLNLHYMRDDIPRVFEAEGLRKKFFPQRMEIPNLRNLFFKLGAIDTWFFTNFNLESTAGHLFVDYSYRTPKDIDIKPGPLLFPNVTRMTVHRRKDLTSVATPALRHLILDLSNDHEGENSVPKRLREGQTPFVTDYPLVPSGSNIPLGSLESLEIGCIWISNPKLFAPFINLRTLVISASQLLSHDGHAQIPEIITEARTSISDPVLPNLHTLGLCFEYRKSPSPYSELLPNDHYEAGLCLAQAFMRRRLDEGNPIQTLRIIGFLPTMLESGPEFTWIRDASGAKIEFVRRKDDFALRLMSPY